MDLIHSFSYLYKKTIEWSESKKSPFYLAAVSFFEACLLFPVPPDPMFATMSLADNKKIWLYAFLSILFSILGSSLAYALGYYAIDQILPYLSSSGFNNMHDTALKWFHTNDLWTTVIAVFVPIPYKFIGLIAGSLHMPIISFVTVCFIRKVIRVTVVGIIMRYKGAKIDRYARLYLDLFGWISIFILLSFLLVNKLLAL